MIPFKNPKLQHFFFIGEQGKPGTNKPFPGLPGPKGDQGPVGKTGAKGPQGAKGQRGQDGSGSSGVKYVRWGRTTCPSGAQIVYKGKETKKDVLSAKDKTAKKVESYSYQQVPVPR